MSVVYAGQIRTALKEIVRRTDSAVARADLIESGTLELGVQRARSATSCFSLSH